MTCRELECLLRVSITNEHKVWDLSVFHYCTLEIFKVSYLIDLIPIPLGDVYMIVGRD